MNRWHQIFCVGLVCVASNFSLVQAQSSKGTEDTADVQLNSVHFVNSELGWVVGDRGVILHTRDGGSHWQRQPTPTISRLEDVEFFDDAHGWAVGGAYRPYMHETQGVVLRTSDGGRTWTQIRSDLLPRFIRIRMLDMRKGWALADGSAMYAAGVFYTDDGGRSWSTIPGQTDQAWLAGDFLDPRHGIAVGTDGHIFIVRRNGFQKTRTPELGTTRFHTLKFSNQIMGWLVGEEGRVMVTQDGGLTWVLVDSLPEEISENFNFQAVAVHSEHCWIAGSPGTVVLHTTDAGRTWNRLPTGQNLPIRDLCFVDPLHGCAVGDLGTILVTEDGGQNWTRQQSGGRRAAIVGYYSEVEHVPLELFARVSADEGYLAVVETFGRRQTATGRNTNLRSVERLREAVLHVGGSSVSRSGNFPLASPALRLPADAILAAWDRANDGSGADRLEEYVVRSIRQWRPDVVVTSAASPAGHFPSSHLMNQIVLAAVKKSADATSYSDQLTVARLSPWQVKKVFSQLPNEQTGSLHVDTSQLSTRLGKSYAQHAANARGLVEERYAPGPHVIGFRLLSSVMNQELARRDFFSGISLSPGGEARRLLRSPTIKDFAALRQMGRKRRNVQKILQQSERAEQQGGGWFGQITELTRGLDTASAGEIMFHLAQRYSRLGRQEMAAEVYQVLIDRHPQHALAEKSMLWLMQYYCSSEAMQRMQGSHAKDLRQDADSHWSRALALAKQAEQSYTLLLAQPAYRFPLITAYREQGLGREAEKIYNQMASVRLGSAWNLCARTEQWLGHGRGLPPKLHAMCRMSNGRPRLDGQLHESIWKNAQRLELKGVRNESSHSAATFMLARDQGFLYFAAICPWEAAASYSEAASGPRSRDAELGSHDRVQLLLDIDRDYTSFYCLTVDYRGWTKEKCFGDVAWNPTWYVAAARDRTQWTIEAAIPLQELVREVPSSRAVWAMGIQRVIPGVGFQAWNSPADVEVIPEGFGLLFFE